MINESCYKYKAWMYQIVVHERRKQKNNRPKKISAHIFTGIVFNSYYCKNYQRQFRYYYTVLEQLFLKMKIVKIWFDREFI